MSTLDEEVREGQAVSGGVTGALAALALVMLLASLGTSIANVALPSLSTAFGASLPQVQWVVLSYLLAVTISVAGAGWLGDAAGRRRVLLAGVALFALASLLCAAAPALWVLIAARVGQGVGGAAMMALALGMVGEAAPAGRSGRVMGLLGAMSAAGTALGPAVGGVLIAASGWRALFLLCAAGAAAGLLLAACFLPREGGRGRRAGLFHPAGLMRLLSDPPIASGFAACALVSAVVMGSLVVGPFYLTYGVDQDAAVMGLAMAVGPVVAALTGVPAGALTDRAGAARVTMYGLLLMVGGCTSLAFLPRGSGVGGYLCGIAVVTAGYAIFQTANNSLIMGRAATAQRGLASGLLTLSRNLGLIGGASAMTWLFGYALAEMAPAAAEPEAVSGAMRTTFAAAAFLVALALTLILGGRMLARCRASREDVTPDRQGCPRAI